MRQSNETGRIAYLDGLRGIAIGLVVLFHVFVWWPDRVPYGNRFADFPLFHYGWLGVELFFLISGFVILMTLDACRSYRSFLYRRWLRLYPAMLFCSALVFLTAPLFLERPAGQPTWESLLPGLTFLQFEFWHRLLGDFPVLEGAFWSIFVEVKFYLLFGALYFWFGRSRAIGGLIAIALVSMAIGAMGLPEAGLGKWLWLANDASGAQFFGWFAAGALFYCYAESRDPHLLAAALGLAVLAAATIPYAHPDHKLVALLLVALFVAAILSPSVQRLCSGRALLVVGFASYPLYLMHENFAIALIVKLGRLAPWIPGLLLPVLPIALVVGVSWLVARHVEPALRRLIRSFAPGPRGGVQPA